MSNGLHRRNSTRTSKRKLSNATKTEDKRVATAPKRPWNVNDITEQTDQVSLRMLANSVPYEDVSAMKSDLLASFDKKWPDRTAWPPNLQKVIAALEVREKAG